MAKSSLELTLHSGSKFNFEVDSRVAQAVAKQHGDGGVFFAIEGSEVFSVNLESVMAVHGWPSIAETEAPKATTITRPLVGTNAVGSNRKGFHNAVPQDDPGSDKALYKIECKCGADYFCRLFSDAKRCKCKQCSEFVFVDSFEQRTGDNGRPAKLATNRYRVPFAENNDIA